MTTHTFYVALPFTRTKEGHLVAGEALVCACAISAAQAAERMSSGSAGAVAFSREMDDTLECCRPAALLTSRGDVPNLDYLLSA